MDSSKGLNKKVFYLAIIILIPSFLHNLYFVKANPVPTEPYFGKLLVGLFNNGTNVQHVRSNVSIDVYDFESKGHGDYLLRNHNNTLVNVPICFVTGPIFYDYENKNISVKVNGTPITGNSYNFWEMSWFEINNTFEEEDLREYLQSIGMDYFEKEIKVFTIEIPASSDILFSVDWNFISGTIVKDYPLGFFSPTRELLYYYYTGYTINGGENWNNQPILSEKISFYFHTDKFFIGEHKILTNISKDPWKEFKIDNYQAQWEFLIENGEIETNLQSENGIPTYELEYFDIFDDIYINIFNVKSNTVLSITGYFLIGILGAGMVLIIIIIKNKKFSKEK
ncbi:MAG: hypothetical protein ACTSWC_07835 [Promethearchaeota archaeon]